MNYIRVYCQEKDCPFHKSSCCLCEISEETVKRDPGITTRNKCKKKNSKMVIGKPSS